MLTTCHVTATEAQMVQLMEVSKRLATLQAHCAVDGVSLHAIGDGSGRAIHIITKGPMTRPLSHLEAVEQWLGRPNPDAAELPA